MAQSTSPSAMFNNANSNAVTSTIGPAKDNANNVVINNSDQPWDVVSKYTWTLTPPSSPAIAETPYILLTEYKVDEAFIKQQISNFLNNSKDIIGDTYQGIKNVFTYKTTYKKDPDPLAPYKSLYKKDQSTKTNNIYKFPYFDDINFEINTSPWESIDALGSAGSIGGELSKVAFGKNADKVNNFASGVTKLGSAALAFSSPKVGVADRPKLWSSHSPRTINIKFPLFNTQSPDDWEKNRNLCKLLINQNLFQKIDTVSNIPPVFYELVIPGQHYSYASAVSKLTINNRGNMRSLVDSKGQVCVVPDAYEVNMTLEDLVMPSQNLFGAIDSVSKQVTTSIRTAQQAIKK